MASRERYKDTDMQAIIGWILRAGVLISISIVVIGGVIYLYRHGHETTDYHSFRGIADFIKTPSGILHGAITLHGRAIIQAGIIMLIATPVLRVIISAIGFVLEKDYLYLFVTLIVLGIILFSMLSGHAG